MAEFNRERSYLIYSYEHNAWWGPCSRGYVPEKTDAGLYSFVEAVRIVGAANRYLPAAAKPNEVMIPFLLPAESLTSSEKEN